MIVNPTHDTPAVSSPVEGRSAVWPRAALLWVAPIAFICMVFLLLLSANMQKPLNHDEHMYVAAGALLARDGLLPYRDFSYLQMPGLPLAYGLLFKIPGPLLLEARLFSTLCATLSLGLIFAVVWLAARGPYVARFVFAAGSVGLVLGNPLFTYTSGQSWNHDLPVLQALAGFALLCLAARRDWHWRWTLLSGLAVGLALGTRLSFAFIAPVFFAAILLHPRAPFKKKLRPALWFLAGLGVSLLPVALLFGAAPAAFTFDNVQYHATNALYWQAGGYTRAMDLPGKLDYLKEVLLQPANLLLLAGVAIAGGGLVAYRKQIGPSLPFAICLAGTAFLLLLVGALAPTPSWYQYFYAPLPFIVLAVSLGAAALAGRARWVVGAFSLFVALSAVLGGASYQAGGGLDAARWVPVQAYEQGQQISSYVHSGKVLTLAPIYALEGGLDVYPQFAAGPFLWRSDSLLSPQQRAEAGVPSAADFDAQVERQPPAAILTGYEGGLESAWVAFAQSHGYQAVALADGKTLWLARP